MRRWYALPTWADISWRRARSGDVSAQLYVAVLNYLSPERTARRSFRNA